MLSICGLPQFCVLALISACLILAESRELSAPANGGSNRPSTILKIVGGVRADTSRYPYMVSLRTPEGDHYCGGALVLPGFVVTAAHCIDPTYTLGETHPYPKLQIGGNDINGDENTEYRETYRTYIHSRWNGQPGHGFDIAVIQLNKPSRKKPIKIDRYGVYLIDYRSRFTAIGYGFNETGGFPQKLQEVQMDYVDLFTCEDYKDYEGKITFDMVCAMGKEGALKDVCQADSGGPLILPPRSRFEHEDLLVGVVSFGKPCTREDKDKDIPSVFTKAEEFRNWILEKEKHAVPREARVFGNPKVKLETPQESEGEAIVSTNPNVKPQNG